MPFCFYYSRTWEKERNEPNTMQQMWQVIPQPGRLLAAHRDIETVQAGQGEAGVEVRVESEGGEMTVKEIAIEYLVKHGFDGLVSDDAECSCEIAGLMPCCFDNCSECKPGYKTECDCGEGCPFHIATQKDAK